MVRCLFKLIFGLIVAVGILLYLWLGRGASTNRPVESSRASASDVQSWANPSSLPDHFARHGADFGARDARDYARLAAQFFQQAKAEGWPAKVDDYGVVRVFDPGSGTFGAYNRDGTTKTFFKPGNARYFDRQPGRPVNLKTLRQ